MSVPLRLAKPALAKWRVNRRDDDVFDVLCPDGKVHGTYPSLSQAAGIAGIQQKRADQAARKMTRACMGCQRPFESEGIHNRMCPICRHRDADGWNPHGIAPRSGRPR